MQPQISRIISNDINEITENIYLGNLSLAKTFQN